MLGQSTTVREDDAGIESGNFALDETGTGSRGSTPETNTSADAALVKDRLPRRYVDTVVGGQAGSEGKGAVVAHLLRENDYAAAVRPGSSNAGHTVYADAADRGDALASGEERWEKYIHQVLPSAATVDPVIDLIMAPESSFGLDEFLEEVQDMVDRWGEGATGRVVVDPFAAVITDHHRHLERDRKLGGDIGSTVHGCGAVRTEKIWRSAGDVRLAKDYHALRDYLPEGADGRMWRAYDVIQSHGREGDAVMVEGTQGALLSMNQSDYWPYTTSRDCIASSFLSSCGLPPSAVRDTWAVFRTYPIRVGGTSGPMRGKEIDFETIANRAGMEEPPVEYTSVTKKKRRVFEWSFEDFVLAVRLNDPDYIALTFLDYLGAENYGATSADALNDAALEFVGEVERAARSENGSRVGLLKTGPLPEHVIDLRGGPDFVEAARF